MMKRYYWKKIYGPNTDSPEFYSDAVFSKINDWAPDYSIFVGDYNVVVNPRKDTKNYLYVNNPNAMRELNNQISSYNLIDIWRDLHPDGQTTLGRNIMKINGLV